MRKTCNRTIISMYRYKCGQVEMFLSIAQRIYANHNIKKMKSVLLFAIYKTEATLIKISQKKGVSAWDSRSNII